MIFDKNRVAHMLGVAEYMYAHASEYGLSPADMFFLGFVHDIGYVVCVDGHERYGAELLGSHPFSEFVASHGLTPSGYAWRHNILETEIPSEMILLWEADMSVDSSGAVVGFDARLLDIGKRHGVGSLAYQTCGKTISWLEKNKNPPAKTNLRGIIKLNNIDFGGIKMQMPNTFRALSDYIRAVEEVKADIRSRLAGDIVDASVFPALLAMIPMPVAAISPEVQKDFELLSSEMPDHEAFEISDMAKAEVLKSATTVFALAVEIVDAGAKQYVIKRHAFSERFLSFGSEKFYSICDTLWQTAKGFSSPSGICEAMSTFEQMLSAYEKAMSAES